MGASVWREGGKGVVKRNPQRLPIMANQRRAWQVSLPNAHSRAPIGGSMPSNRSSAPPLRGSQPQIPDAQTKVVRGQETPLQTASTQQNESL